MTLGRREHAFEEKPGGWRECLDCGKEMGPQEEALPLCPGPPEERSTLDPGPPLERKEPFNPNQPIARVSPDRDRKRSSSVTGERLVFGPVCDWIRTQSCWLTAQVGSVHRCRKRPGRRELIEVCHLKGRGMGSGRHDWIVVDGVVRLNVLPGCMIAHDALDNHRGTEHLSAEEVRDTALAERDRLEEECPVPIPEHYKLKARGELV